MPDVCSDMVESTGMALNQIVCSIRSPGIYPVNRFDRRSLASGTLRVPVSGQFDSQEKEGEHRSRQSASMCSLSVHGPHSLGRIYIEGPVHTLTHSCHVK